MKTSNAEEIRLKGVEIWFFTPFFVLEAQWWNMHTQFNDIVPAGRCDFEPPFGGFLADNLGEIHIFV